MKTVCPQCHTDGHHKMSCADESNQARKDRVTFPATVREPIVVSQMDRCPCPRCQSDRLGDYYAGLTNNDWLNLVREHSRLKALVVAHGLVAIAHHTFRSGSSLSAQMTALDFAKASDAFAYGALKYGRVGDWRNVPLDHHLQSAGGHFDAWLKDHASIDSESGLTHEAHFLARAVMIQEIRRTK